MTSPRRSRGGNHGGKGTSARQQALAAQAQLSSEEESSDADSVTRCVCTQQHHVGLMVQCDKCEVWQHCDCVGLSEEDIPDQYYCELCKPENHTIVKGHGRNKRVYNPNGAKETASKKSPKKRTTMNSREASVPLSDAILHRTTKSNSIDENVDYTTGRTSKRRRRTEGADRDDDDNEPHTNGRGGSHDSHDAKSQRSTSPASSRNSNPSRKKETSKSSNDSAGSNNGVKRSRSGSPAVTVQEPRSYESDNEASSGSGGGTGLHASSSSVAGKKRRRNDDKTPPSRQGSSSANDDDAKIDPNDERESLADALFVKTELSDVETPLGGDDEEIEPVKSGSTVSEHRKEPHSSSSTKANGAGPRSTLIKRSLSGSRRNPPPHSSNMAKSRDNNLSAHRDSHASSSRPRSRTSTPQPADKPESNGSSSHSSSHDKDRSRCPSPPAKVRYPSTRMSLSEMNKRAKQILEYISRLQVEMADKKDEPAGDADVDEDESPVGSGKRRHTPVIVVETDKDMVVAHAEALRDSSEAQDGEVADDKTDLPHDLVTAAVNIVVTATAASTPSPNADGTSIMDIDMDESNVEMLQPESASSSATTIPLERPRSVSPSPIVAKAQPPATVITVATSDPHIVHPQPSLSSSSTSSTISSATTTLTSDAEIALASSSASIVNHSAGDLSSVEMMDKLARELIKFQRKFGHHHDINTANGLPSSSSSSALAANGSSSTSTMLSAAQIQHHHNTRERERSERERERSAEERDRDVVESLLLMSADLGAALSEHHLHPIQHHHLSAGRHSDREGSAGSAFSRRNEGAGGRRAASVTVR